MDPRKEAICNALATFIRQRPGLEWANYATSNHAESRRAYFADRRAIERDKRDAETLLRAVRHNDGISADALLEASRRAFSGRLSLTLQTVERLDATSAGGNYGERPYTDTTCRVTYCAGQYFPTEYRRAAAAVCAAALWGWQRENMPAPEYHATQQDIDCDSEPPTYEGRSAGDWLRRHFRQQFGSALQKRYFD